MGTGHSILKPFQTRFKPFIGQPVCCCQIPLCHNLFRFWFLVTRCFQIPYMGVGHSKRPLWTKYLFENRSWAFKASALNSVFFENGSWHSKRLLWTRYLFWKWQLVTICKCWWASFEAASTFFTFANLLSEWFSLPQVPVWALFFANSFCRHSKRRRWTNILTNQQLRLGTHTRNHVTVANERNKASTIIFQGTVEQTIPFNRYNSDTRLKGMKL